MTAENHYSTSKMEMIDIKAKRMARHHSVTGAVVKPHHTSSNSQWRRTGKGLNQDN
jgi:hypothetical protein